MGFAFYAYSQSFSSLLFLFFLPSSHSLCMYGYTNSIVGKGQAMVQQESLFFVITCETVGTVDWMCFLW